MAETKLQKDAVAKAHGLPVTLLPCDWTAILSEFKKKFGSQIPDDRLPAQSMFEHFSEKLADGTLKAKPLFISCGKPVRGGTARHEEARSIPPIQSTAGFPPDYHHKEATSEFGASG